MSKVDLSRFQFDYDLTFAMLVLDRSGQVVSRFGGRDHHDATGWQSSQAMQNWLKACLEELSKKTPKTTKVQAQSKSKSKPKTIYDIPAFSKKFANKRPDCVHCHSVFPAMRRQAIQDKTWQASERFVYPSPKRIGLVMDAVHQGVVQKVLSGSAAHEVGIKTGDKILALEDTRILSISDLQHALHLQSGGPGIIGLKWQRTEKAMSGKLKLQQGWKVASPLEYSWRPMKWELSPAPGFGGRKLSTLEKAKLKIEASAFGLRVGYLVNWGERGALGRSAAKAGLRKGDVLLDVNGKANFRDAQHFHAWVRLKCKVGDVLTLRCWRKGKIITIKIPLIAG